MALEVRRVVQAARALQPPKGRVAQSSTVAWASIAAERRRTCRSLRTPDWDWQRFAWPLVRLYPCSAAPLLEQCPQFSHVRMKHGFVTHLRWPRPRQRDIDDAQHAARTR